MRLDGDRHHLGAGAVRSAETVQETEARERAGIAAEYAARKAAEVANRCPRCMGEGRIAQFTHRKGGECFLCGGSGVFARYTA